ncbi:tape measure protein [Acinetobacter baumannii]|uniref:Phage tail tape measure protein n=1 Tax=Acinetobacter baumannii TaxID=470 RepID=A0AA44XNL0_ACIBA|nr:tape measure protein [Acinetobacter baumannii]PQL81970.1 phage tail tape measure protein [Acinetobacter baumannii]
MAQESRLVVVIDSQNAVRNAKALADEMSKITEKGDSATRTSKELGNQINITNNIVQKFNTTVNNSSSVVSKTSEVTKQATQQVQKYGQEIKTTTQELDKQEKSARSYSTAIKSLAGYMAGLVTINAAINNMDTYTGLQNRLKLVTNNQAELNKATEDTFQIAQKTYSAWDSVLQVYQRFSDNAKTLNLTMDDTARLTETVSKAVAISGASAEAADAALVQFGQALASGTLRGEELNSVMEQTPALAKAIAQGMGITVGELRSIAAEGKITSQAIVKALRNVESDVDALFAKTDITIGQSLTLLNNEITKFVGEAGKGSGAAQVLAGSIQTLASNLDLIADGALVVGIGYITRAILMKSTAVKEGMTSTLASRQASVLNAQAEYAEATAALNAAKAHLANVRATSAETQAKFGATAAATRYAQAQAAVTAATNVQTAAQIKLNTATSIAGRLAKGAFGLIGGWAGVATLGVMGLAAAYSYFNNKAEEAKQKLAEQAKVAEKADEELKKLTGNDKAKAVNDLTTAFNKQNEALEKSSRAVGSVLIDIENYARGNREVEKISKEARTGTISYTEAIERLNKIKLPTDLYENLKKQAAQYDDNASKASLSAEKLKLLRVEVKLGGNEAQNAAIQHQKQADALGNTATEAEKATKALQDYQAKQKDSVIDSIYKSGWLDKGYTVAQANAILELQKAKGMSAILSKDEIDSALRNLKIIEAQQEREDKLTEAKRKQTQEIEKQAKLTKRLVGISGQSGIGTGPHLDVRYGGSMSGQKVSNEHLARLQAGGKPLSSYKISSNYGPRKAPTKGASSFHKGIDFSMPEGTPITTNVAVKDIKTWYDSKGGGYVSEVIFEDGVSLKLLHQSPKMQSKVKGGASKGSDKAAGDIQSQLDRQLDAQRSLENEVASEVQRIQNNLKVRLEDVDKAGFSPERTAEIKAELQRRADNDVAIAKQAIRSKLEDYKEFRKTEEQLLEESFNRKKFNAAHDIELSKSEQKQAVELLEQQYQQELGLMKLAQEQRAFQARLSLLAETQAMQERYRLEREEIIKNTKLSIEERQKLIALSKATQDKETRDKVNNAVQNWGGIQADMNGTSEFFRQDQERFSRLNAANDLANSQFAATDLDEKNGLDSLNAQMEAGLIKQQDYENQKTAIIQAAQDQRNQIAAEYAQNAQDIEDKYHQDRLNAQIALGGQMMGSLTSMFGSMFGEQSKAYKIMFAADKAYAIAAAGIAIQQNIAAASKVGFPLNLPLIAGAVAQGASIIANIRAIKDQGFAEGGYTGRGGKYEVAGAVHKGEIVWSQEDIKRWGGVGLVEKMRKSANPEAFLNNNASADSVMRRAMMSSSAFIESQKQSDIFNQPVQDTQIIYKGNRSIPIASSSASSDLFHDGKVYFSSNGLVQNRSNLEDVQDFTMGQAARPHAEIMPSIEPSSPTINFKIEVINQVSGATVEAEQLDEQTVRIIVKDELDKQLPRTVPKLVSDQIANPNSTISRSLTENTTARRNRT